MTNHIWLGNTLYHKVAAGNGAMYVKEEILQASCAGRLLLDQKLPIKMFIKTLLCRGEDPQLCLTDRGWNGRSFDVQKVYTIKGGYSKIMSVSVYVLEQSWVGRFLLVEKERLGVTGYVKYLWQDLLNALSFLTCMSRSRAQYWSEDMQTSSEDDMHRLA